MTNVSSSASSSAAASSSYTYRRQDWEVVRAKHYFDRVENALNNGKFSLALNLYDSMVKRDIFVPKAVADNDDLHARLMQITKNFIFYDLLPPQYIKLKNTEPKTEVILYPIKDKIRNLEIQRMQKAVFRSLDKGNFANASILYRYAVYEKRFQSTDSQINKELYEIKKTLEIAMLRFQNRFKLNKKTNMVMLLPRIPSNIRSTVIREEAVVSNTGRADTAALKENKTRQEKKKETQTTMAKPRKHGQIYPLMPTEKRKGVNILGVPCDLIFYR